MRSASRIDAEVLAAARRLRVVARAGVGLDNVDVEAATQAGVMVVNAPTSNIVTAAEHAIALLLATARNVPQAHASLKRGEWQRSRYTGVELRDKTLGVLGLGRIGVLVAQRLAAFDMNVIAYDPYIQAPRAAQLGVRLVSLEELLRDSDFITVHLPRTQETVGLIGDRELRMVKPSVRIVNAARGGIVDEDALDLALKEKRVAGAGIDVFRDEPCTDSPLFHHDNVVVTPHLGASTHEAQERAEHSGRPVGTPGAVGEFVPDAVNVRGGVVAEEVKPGLPLTEKLGRVFTALAGGVAGAAGGRGARRDRPVRREGAGAGGAQGRVHRHRRGLGDVRERAAAVARPWRGGDAHRRMRTAPTGGTSSRSGARWPTARSSRCPAR